MPNTTRSTEQPGVLSESEPALARELGAQLAGASFTDPRFIGSGSFGQVWQMHYSGDDQTIKSFCDPDNQLIVKTITQGSAEDIEHEAAISNHLHHQSMTQDNPSPAYVLQGSIALDETTVLLSKPVYYNAENKTVAKSLSEHIRENSTTFAVENKIGLDNIAQQMKQAQDALHANDVIHGDTALRNYLVGDHGDKIYICDYGLSSKALENTYGFRNDVPQNIYDMSALKSRTRTLKTDSFALKTSMLALVGMRAGVISEHAAVSGGKSMAEVTRIRASFPAETESEDSLKFYLNNVVQEVAKLEIDDPRKEEIYDFLLAYENYLTTMPSAEKPLLSTDKKRELDELSLHKSMNQYVKNTPLRSKQVRRLTRLESKKNLSLDERRSLTDLTIRQNSQDRLQTMGRYNSKKETKRHRYAEREHQQHKHEDVIDKQLFDKASADFAELSQLSSEEKAERYAQSDIISRIESLKSDAMPEPVETSIEDVYASVEDQPLTDKASSSCDADYQEPPSIELNEQSIDAGYQEAPSLRDSTNNSIEDKAKSFVEKFKEKQKAIESEKKSADKDEENTPSPTNKR